MPWVQNPFSAHPKTLSPNVIGLITYRNLTVYYAQGTHLTVTGTVISITVSSHLASSHMCLQWGNLPSSPDSESHLTRASEGNMSLSLSWEGSSPKKLPDFRKKLNKKIWDWKFFFLSGSWVHYFFPHSTRYKFLSQIKTVQNLWQRWLPMLSNIIEAHCVEASPSLHPNSPESHHLLDAQRGWDYQKYLK